MRVVVAGTGTEVGKTFVTAALARGLIAEGLTVAARKPVLSYDTSDAQTDAEVLANATNESPERVCPSHRRLPLPMAPPMAADALGRAPFTIAELAAGLGEPAVDVVLVESAGGVRSPLASDGDTTDLVRALGPHVVVLVADAGLGTINQVRLAVHALESNDIVVMLNRFDAADELHRRNAEWLRSVDGIRVVTDADALTKCVRSATKR